MSRSFIRLIYSDNFSVRAERDRELWEKEKELQWFKNPHQLNLFDGESIKREIIMISFSGMTYHSFQKIVQEYSPKVIIDTRKYPDFFSVFPSLKEARREFSAQNIKYLSLPYEELLQPVAILNFIEKLKQKKFSQNRFPAFVFFSNKPSMEKINILRHDERIISKFSIKDGIA